MVSEEYKQNIDKAVEFIESCWDENNPGDNLSFDERVTQRMDELSPEVKQIVQNSMDW